MRVVAVTVKFNSCGNFRWLMKEFRGLPATRQNEIHSDIMNRKKYTHFPNKIVVYQMIVNEAFHSLPFNKSVNNLR